MARNTILFALALALAGLLAARVERPREGGARRRRCAPAQAVSVRSGDGEAVEVGAEPCYRWDARRGEFNDGTVWVLGKTGRPTAALHHSLDWQGLPRANSSGCTS
ncbi:MAG: hypothetical protein WKF75_00840 [Singulisphaera sp.]